MLLEPQNSASIFCVGHETLLYYYRMYICVTYNGAYREYLFAAHPDA